MRKISAIYVIELVPGKVKIGQTVDWDQRLTQYTHGGVLEPVCFEIFPVPSIFLRDAESLALKRTDRWKIKGEWRFCDFETAANVVRDIHAHIEAGHFELPRHKREPPVPGTVARTGRPKRGIWADKPPIKRKPDRERFVAFAVPKI